MNEKFRELEEYFKQPINNSFTKPKPERVLITSQGSVGDFSMFDKELWEPKFNDNSKGKHLFRTRKPVDVTCRVFFSLVKPQGAPNGTRFILLYSPPLYAILDQANEELEMIPKDAQFYFEGRYIIVSFNNVERIYSIKSDAKKLYDLTKNNNSDEILQFFLCCQLNRYLVPPIFLTNPFYNKVVNNERFFFLASKHPYEYYNDETLDNYIRASEPFIDTLLELLLDEFIKPLEYEISQFPKGSFLYHLLLMMIDEDENITILKTACEKSRKPQEAFVLGYEIMPLNDRSKMVLHLVYSVCEKYFPGSTLGIKLINSIMLNVIANHLNLKKLGFKADLILQLENLHQGTLTPSLYKRYTIIANEFKSQPANFILNRKGTFSYDSFIIMVNFTWMHITDFIKICEANKVY